MIGFFNVDLFLDVIAWGLLALSVLGVALSIKDEGTENQWPVNTVRWFWGAFIILIAWLIAS